MKNHDLRHLVRFVLKEIREGNDMASMDVGQGSPSGRMWENEVTDSGVTSKDFVALAFFVKSLDKEWKKVLQYSKTNPDAASDSLNNVYKLTEDIKRKADEIKLNVEPYLK